MSRTAGCGSAGLALMTIGEVNVVLAGQQSLNAGIIDLNTFAVFEFKASGLTHAAEMKHGNRQYHRGFGWR